MAENEQEGAAAAEGATDAPKGGKLKLIIIVVGALFLLGGGAATWFFFFRHDDERHAEAPLPKPPTFVEVPEMLVNLANAPGERVQYLKLKVVLEVKEDEKHIEQIKWSLPRITDLFQTYMRELRPTDLNGSAGMFRLKEELTRRVNNAVAPSQVAAVLFKEIIVQ